jgi:hypothetical protein
MADEECDSLSAEFEELIRAHYPPGAQSAVRRTLMSYRAAKPGPGTDRVQYDLLLLGAGDAAKLKNLADLAAQDPRDIMQQEYFWVDGRSYPHTWARRHAVNRNWDHLAKHEKEHSRPLNCSFTRSQEAPPGRSLSFFLPFFSHFPTAFSC